MIGQKFIPKNTQAPISMNMKTVTMRAVMKIFQIGSMFTSSCRDPKRISLGKLCAVYGLGTEAGHLH